MVKGVGEIAPVSGSTGSTVDYVGDVGLLCGHREARPQRVGIVYFIGSIELGPVHLTLAGDVRRNVVKREIARHIGNEMHAGVTGEKRELAVDEIAFGLQRDNIVIKLVKLVFI